MISDRGFVTVSRKSSPYSYAPTDADRAQEFIDWRAQVAPGEEWTVTPAPSCRVCGEPAWPNLRCTKHQDRNPCAAEGCRRTRAAHGDLRDDASLCGEHWRQFVPPGSPTRRAFNRLARVAKLAGYRRSDRWPDELEDRWWRLWRGVIRRVRRAADGHIDQALIERMFGWDHEA
jgi:hypothetical protein